MTEDDWTQFLASGVPTVASVCRISDAVRRRLGTGSDLVLIHHSYALKLRTKHNIKLEHLPMIENTVRFGAGLIDKDNRAIFFYDDCSVFNWTFQATLKAVPDRNEVWLASFHKVCPSEVRRMMRKSEVVQRPM